MRKTHYLSRALMLLLALAATGAAQDKLLTLDEIYDPAKRVNFGGTPPPGLTATTRTARSAPPTSFQLVTICRSGKVLF